VFAILVPADILQKVGHTTDLCLPLVLPPRHLSVAGVSQQDLQRKMHLRCMLPLVAVAIAIHPCLSSISMVVLVMCWLILHSTGRRSCTIVVASTEHQEIWSLRRKDGPEGVGTGIVADPKLARLLGKP
jgi:hypothetical protein